MDRRRLLALAPLTPIALASRGPRVSVSPEFLDDLARSAAELQDGYATAPPAFTAQRVRRDLPVVRGLLRDGGLTSGQQRRMHVTAGRLAALLGNAQLDIGWAGRAIQTLSTARVHASLGKDATGTAWCLLLRSTAQRHDHPGSALADAHEGLSLAPAGSPVAARLHAEGVAMCAAKLGDRRTYPAALDEAWRTLRGFGPTQRGVPGWHPEHLHPAELDCVSAAAYNAAGNPGAALLHTESGIARLDGSPALGHRAYIRINAADAMLARGEYDAGLDLMAQALDVSAGRKLAEIGDCARQFLVAARASKAPDWLVNPLAEQIRHWQATAPV